VVRRWFALVGAAVLLTSCGGSSAPGRAAPHSPTAAPSPTLTAFTGLVDIGSGRHLFVRCLGTGSPTVIFESGDESKIDQWDAVQPRIAERTTTCAYDRFGNGASDPPTKACRRLADLRGDLEALLRVRGLPAPYVLAGTSGGGFLMAGFAYAHPGDVRGIVFAETPHAIVPAESPPDLLAQLKCDAPSNVEHRDYVSVENEAWSDRHLVGDIPMTVITNDYQGTGTNNEERTNVQGQRGWLVLSPQARQIVVTSGHAVPENEPDLTVREILRVLDVAGKR
jgi:pimeloyl-ACP methyl ester carboxylesterase